MMHFKILFLFACCALFSCTKNLELRSVTIQKIELHHFPQTDTSGNPWDIATANDSAYADPFMTIISGDTASNVNHWIRTDTDMNNAGITAIYDQTFPVIIDDPNRLYTFGLYDFDASVVDAQLMSSMTFRFSRYKELSPSELSLSNGQMSLKFFLDWEYENI